MQSWWRFLEEILSVQVQPGTSGFDRVIGIDEAGRGPLAGPVVVVGVVLPKDHGIVGLDDSKKLSEVKREGLFGQIAEVGEIYIEKASAKVIDRDGILNVTKLLMRRVAMKAKADFVLTDAVGLNVMNVPQLALTKGDARVDCIAAASIVAKVTRDRLMVEYDFKFPGYGLREHKGYGTKEHYDGIRRMGKTRIHRISFLTSFDFSVE